MVTDTHSPCLFRCVLGKPDCGLLTDNMALMWGDCKDAVDELTTIMAENEKAYPRHFPLRTVHPGVSVPKTVCQTRREGLLWQRPFFVFSCHPFYGMFGFLAFHRRFAVFCRCWLIDSTIRIQTLFGFRALSETSCFPRINGLRG